MPLDADLKGLWNENQTSLTEAGAKREWDALVASFGVIENVISLYPGLPQLNCLGVSAVGMFSSCCVNEYMTGIFSAVGHLEGVVLRIAGIAVNQQGGLWWYKCCHSAVWND